jgi:Protein kinase domain/Ankyrin repeat
VLYSHSQRVWKIADFGVASKATSKRAITTNYGRGTEGFRAPELLSTFHYTNKVDIWAIGCILYETLMRTPLFQYDYLVHQLSQSRKVDSLFQLHLSDAQLSDTARKHLSACIREMLDLDPQKRPTALALTSLFESYCIIWDPDFLPTDIVESLRSYSKWRNLIENTAGQPEEFLPLLRMWYELNAKNDNPKPCYPAPPATDSNEIFPLLEKLADRLETEKMWESAIALRRRISIINPTDAHRQTETITTIEAKLKRVNSEFLEAVERGQVERMQLFLDEGVNLNAEGGKYGNALQAAVLEEHTDIIRFLLEKGADVNATGGTYGNALQAAAYLGWKEVASLLLEKGANVNAEGGKYGNALQAAAVTGKGEMVAFLLANGADLDKPVGYYAYILEHVRKGEVY